MKINISVIVPVFNTAKYLKQCLDSLCAQSVPGIEFILVDDGSTDGSGSILKEYADNDSRFKLITQENRGFAGARNRGIEEASGEFIGFVDSDDWIEPDMFQKLWEIHNTDFQADIIQCSCIHEYVNESVSIPICNKAIIKLLANSGGKLKGSEALILDDGTIWNRIYRRSMIKENDIGFKEEMTFGEDVFFYWRALIAANKIIASPEYLYHYRRNRPGSQVASTDRRIFAYFKTISGIDRFVKEQGHTELIPWVNHLKLSFLSWGFERLNPEFHQEYFEQYRRFLVDSGTGINSPLSFPPLSGNIMYDLRYMVLRILHPLTLRAVLNGSLSGFLKIIKLRKFLSGLPLILRR
ncbi:MAG: glycosyltransferase [Lentisphaeria bacterium]|nr:glycosyltransferase [Lentisphaeria bacterium]